jgi:hypothetical protein
MALEEPADVRFEHGEEILRRGFRHDPTAYRLVGRA